MPETASEKEQLWQLGEARVFDQMTSDQASGGLKHEYYHLQDQHHDPFQMTRPNCNSYETIQHYTYQKNEVKTIRNCLFLALLSFLFIASIYSSTCEVFFFGTTLESSTWET